MQYAYMAQKKSQAMHFLLVEIHIYQKQCDKCHCLFIAF